MKLDPRPEWFDAPGVRAVMGALEREGGPDCARFVGGCVRNAVMGLSAADIDIAVTLEPERSMAALQADGIRVEPTGVAHGTVTAIWKGRPFEITTLRRDVETDGRRAVVAYTQDWSEDAARRDFRLNALYADRQGRIHDPTGHGVDDARSGRIVFVGEPEARIREDYLRILRFFRFYAWYGRGAPDARALSACALLSRGMASLSAERIGAETLKLLAAPDPTGAVRLMAGSGVLAEILGEGAASAGRLEHFAALVPLERDPLVRLAALVGGRDAEAERVRAAAFEAAGRLRLSNAQRDRLAAALVTGESPLDRGPAALRAMFYREGPEATVDRAALAAAALAAACAPPAAEALERIRTAAREWVRPSLPVGGDAARQAGARDGPAIGAALRALEAWWIDHDFPQTGVQEALIAIVNAGRPQ